MSLTVARVEDLRFCIDLILLAFSVWGPELNRGSLGVGMELGGIISSLGKSSYRFMERSCLQKIT